MLLIGGLAACNTDPVGPGAEFSAAYELQTIDGHENPWVISEAGSTVVVEISRAEIDLRNDLSCVMQRELSQLDQSDPLDWVQTIIWDWADCTYVIDNGRITMTFPSRDGEVRGDGGPPFLLPNGGILSGSYSRVDVPRGDHVFVDRTLTITEDGSVYVYRTPENSGGGGGGCFFAC